MRVQMTIVVEPVAVFQREGETDRAYVRRVRDAARRFVREALATHNCLRVVRTSDPRIVVDRE